MSSLFFVDIDKPKYDQSTYLNRAKHFFLVTNPLNLLASNAELERARRIVRDYKAGKPVPECNTVDELWHAKYLYDSAFHPDTGEKSIIFGRMSAQVPMNTLITGCLLTFYKTTVAVVFWQWFNQTFNALVNYTNRSGSAQITTPQLITSYVLATGGALTTALSLNKAVKNFPPLVGRLVPFMAITAGNCINVPMMRLQEIRHGAELFDENNNKVGASKKAASIGISAVILSRIVMALPGMALTPVLVQNLTNKGYFYRYPWANAPVQMIFCGICLVFATPMGCALFNQKSSIKVTNLEKDVKKTIIQSNPALGTATLWYNKGL